jgi:hypothetical protein
MATVIASNQQNMPQLNGAESEENRIMTIIKIVLKLVR